MQNTSVGSGKPKLSKRLRKALHHIEEARKILEALKNQHDPAKPSFGDICDVYLMLGETYCNVTSIRESIRANGGALPDDRIIKKPPLADALRP